MTPPTRTTTRKTRTAARPQPSNAPEAGAKPAARATAGAAPKKALAPKPGGARRAAAAGPAPRRKSAAAAKSATPATPPKRARPALADLVVGALEDLKAQNVTVLDVRELTDVTDTIVIASGTSDRHVKSLAGRVVERVKEAGYRSMGLEGEREGEWVLVDLQDVILHVMLPRVREFYGLEKLWDVRSAERAAG